MQIYHSMSSRKCIRRIFIFLVIIVIISIIGILQIPNIKNRNRYMTTTWNQNGITQWPTTWIHREQTGYKFGDHLYHLRKILNNESESPEKEGDDFTPGLKTNNRSYVLNIGYPGQQGAAVRALSSFQCFLGSLNLGLTIVEPYIENTHFRGYSSKDNVVKFSDIFDFEHFNSASRNISYAELVRREEFVHQSPNHTILVFTKTKTIRTQRVIWSSKWSGKGVKCLGEADIDNLSSADKELISTSRNILHQVKKASTCVSRVIELDISHYKKKQKNKSRPFYDVRDFIFHRWSPEEVTLVFNFWSGPYSIPVTTATRRNMCKHNYSTDRTKFQYTPSKRLIRDAEKYEKMFLGRRNKLAIMIRVERVLEYLKERDKAYNESKSLAECFQEVSDLSQNIVKSMEPTVVVPLVTMDVGKYGSHTMNKTNYKGVIRLSKKTLVGFYRENEWSFQDWENSFIEASGGMTNSGYIGALQRILASRAECLVLVGGGNYQALAVQDYMNYHNQRKCIHLVCSMTEKNTLVQKTIEKFAAQKSMALNDII